MDLAPVARRSVVDGAYEQLATQILEGALGAGEVLPAERRLTELLGVNRQAVREALQRLAQEGLVAIQHGGATKVTDFRRSGQLHLLPRLLVNDAGGIDKTVVRSVVEMRAALAPDIARLAAGRALPEHIERAESAMQTMDDPATTPPERSVVNLDMWDALVDASDNIAYRFAYNSLRSCFEPVAGLLADTLAVELNDVDGRRALLTAIRHGDAGAAADAAVALLAPSNSALTQLIGEL